ncbi:hypothetical protein [Dyella subtropica]|uniref:hypothetical protein n=1 Tax=Dyella subtropica TaxID=2992127 RepID=UPI00224FFAFC|nr:hypothetical protein [Dyella subtropica]
MQMLLLRAARSPWLLVACIALYVGFIGPPLISATSTFAVVVGLMLFGLLAAWTYRFLRRVLRHKE